MKEKFEVFKDTYTPFTTFERTVKHFATKDQLEDLGKQLPLLADKDATIESFDELKSSIE